MVQSVTDRAPRMREHFRPRRQVRNPPHAA
jgi:hypothetical protein